MNLENRHEATRHIMKQFRRSHLPPHLLAVSQPCFELAETMVEALPDNPELVAGLRKLLEAKDCFVRTAQTIFEQELPR